MFDTLLDIVDAISQLQAIETKAAIREVNNDVIDGLHDCRKKLDEIKENLIDKLQL